MLPVDEGGRDVCEAWVGPAGQYTATAMTMAVTMLDKPTRMYAQARADPVTVLMTIFTLFR